MADPSTSSAQAPSTSPAQAPSSSPAQALASVIKSIESGGNPAPARFELEAFTNWSWTPVYDRIVSKHRCSADTAKMIACTSWGAYQMLGVNVFDPAISGIDPPHRLAYENDAAMQDASFAGFIKAKGIDWTLEELLGDADKMQKFCAAWNGPKNTATYAGLIRARATQ